MLRTVVVILVFVGALFVIVSRPPEQVFARSSDGVVTLEGVSRRVRGATIDEVQTIGVPLDSRLSKYYVIVPDLAGVVFRPTVTVRMRDSWNESSVIFLFDGPKGGWVPQPTSVDLTSRTLQAHIDLSEPVWMTVGVP